MFPEYRDLITRLKTTDHHFTRLFDKHNETRRSRTWKPTLRRALTKKLKR